MPGQPEPCNLVVHSLETFMLLPLPPRTYLMHPIIPDQGLTLLYAPRGVGKTQLAIMISLAVSSFGVNIHNWRCEQRSGVLFIDGEMQAYSLQERLAAFIKGAGINPAESLFKLITPDRQPCPLPNLAHPSGQAAIEPHLKDVSLVVLDNLASLCSAGKENETESWIPVQRWLLDLRRRGISVLVVHHAGKNGDQALCRV
ncbi:AAA family ATPase [Desulfovibrio sp. OttesenSCG-928-G11]|nr:AAA family ATPase [Desulfovibrio sp. OttesenSCG-928-G11]